MIPPNSRKAPGRLGLFFRAAFFGKHSVAQAAPNQVRLGSAL